MWLLAGLCLVPPVASETRYNPFAGNKPQAAPQAAPAGASGNPAAPGKVSHLTLKAVIPMGNPPMANIDGTILAVGEKFGSYTLVAVGEQGVTLQRGGRRFQLMFEYGRKKDEAETTTTTTAAPSPGAS